MIRNLTGTGKTGGSRRKFVNKELNVILLHQPHPGNIIKTYAIKQIIEHLSAKGYIKK
ncbi:type II toxin-antitoxin system HicA family toxin [Chitinophaga sp. 22620]|uniref:type II toxin-antitoxin system HicA family toxin n=1 Tax=Chitinophaga sp. 22620 TaxID=3453952 RepID=UPI003F826F6F